MLASVVAALPFTLKAESLSAPPLTGRVVDLASLLSPDQQQSLTQSLALLEQQTGHQLVIVTLPDLRSYPIEEWGLQLGRQWGIGGKEKDNGILLIVAPNDRAVRIEVGYGLEGLVPDALAHAIIQKRIVPYFKQGDFAGGIEAGTSALIGSLNGKAEEVAKQITDESGENETAPLLFLPIFFGFVLFMLLRTKGHYNRYRRWNRQAGFPIITIGSGNGRGFGGGGFSGGGGSFGGGGASGRW